jgi:hypothetical protein
MRDMVADLSFDKVGRHMTQLSHVVSSRVMWLSMRARSPSARSPSTRRCASTPLGPIGPRSHAERCPPPTTPTVLAFSNRRPWSAAVGGTFCPVSSQGVWPYRRSIRSLQVARASVWSRAFRWDCSAWSHPSHRFVSGARIIAASVAGLPVRASSRHRPIRISAPPRGHTGMHARLSGSRQAETRGRRGPSVAVRGKPTVHTDRPRGRTPSAICPWTPRHSGPRRYKVTHDGTEKKRPA